MLPRLHAIEDALLLLWWQAGETLQLPYQCLLTLGREASELRIAQQRTLLLSRRYVLVMAKPIASVSSLGRARRELVVLILLVLPSLWRRFPEIFVLRYAGR